MREVVDLASPTVTAADRDRPAIAGGLEVGAEVGRYRILGRLGEGGMGVVYTAHDAELGRDVALKVLRHAARTGDAGQSRLVGEARAMAKLAHPNVVPVFDAGVLGDEVFVTMELVAGVSLDAWCRARRRTWRELLGVFVQAGRGLAAAHAAGIVHRDVKPSNLLVGDDGRVRVVDFGLARPAGSEQDGVVAGTPAYMAPEQRAGAVDERSDQYSFGLAFLKLLGDQRYPGALRGMLERATAEDPDARFGSMPELVGELVAIQARDRRRRGALVVAATALAAGAASYAVASRGEADRCAPAVERLAGVWDPELRARIVARFPATDPVLGTATAAAVIDQLERYAARWLDERAAACREPLPDPDLVVRRYACLDRALAETRALTELLAAPPRREIVRGAVEAVLDLPAPESCRDLLALQAATPLPPDPVSRARIAGLRQRLDRAAAHRRTGDYAAGLAIVAGLPELARSLRYAPAEAEALLVAAELEDWGGDPARAERLYREAALAAGRAGDDVRLATASAARLYVLGVLGRGERALDQADLALALAARTRSPAIEALVHNHLGTTHLRRGELPRAAAELERALALREQAFGPDHPLVASTLSNLGAVRRRERRLDDAEALQRRALAIKRRVLGADHPEVAQVLTNLGAVASDRGDHRAAFALEAQALALRTRALGGDHLEVAQSLNNQGSYAMADRRWADAAAVLERAAGIFRATLPAKHPHLGRTLANLGETYVNLGRAAAAVSILEEAVAILAPAGPAHAIDLANARYGLGAALIGRSATRPRGCELLGLARDTYHQHGSKWERDAEALLARSCRTRR